MKKYVPAPLVSAYPDWCQGARDSNRYLLAINVAAAKISADPAGLPWPSQLGGTVAFDLAEVSRAHLGQINCIEVSSFCSPDAIIWGVDVARPKQLFQNPLMTVRGAAGRPVPVFDGGSLVMAAEEVFGRGTDRHFPLAPGTLCPAAVKSIIRTGEEGIIYAACGVGLPPRRSRQAALLMEDTGFVPRGELDGRAERQRLVTEATAKAVVAVGVNQGVRYRAVIVAYAEVSLARDEIGCALAIAPYFTLAQRGWPHDGLAGLRRLSLEDWREAHFP